MRVLISGASGLIGSALATALRNAGHDVVRLVRRLADAPDERTWDPAAGVLLRESFDGVGAVVNLSGAGIGDRRWNAARRREIVASRLDSTRLLATTMASLEDPPRVFVSQSAIGFYGDRGDEVLTEDSAAGSSDEFLTRLTVEWEQAAEPARRAGIRVVHPRTGLVLAPDAQLLGRLAPLFKLGLGGPIGSGRQWWSWITLDDEIAALLILLDADLEGPVNLVSPNPVRNEEFAAELGAVLRRPTVLRVPRVAIRAVMGPEMADELSLSSTRVQPARLIEHGFTFRHPRLGEALADLLGRR